MKNKKVLALVLVIAVMLMGASYAYWTQDLTATATLSTGELLVEITDATVEDQDDYADATVEVPTAGNGMEVVLTADDLYPGASFEYDVTVTNNGTMAVKPDNILSVGKFYTYDAQGNETEYPMWGSPNYVPEELAVNFSDTTDLINLFYDGENPYLPAPYGNPDAGRIEPGESKTYTFVIGLSEDADNDFEIKAYKFVIKPMFVQFNQ